MRMQIFFPELPITKKGMMEYRHLTCGFEAARVLLRPSTGGSEMEGRRGFTLIELLIVLAIVGIGLVMATSNLQIWLGHTNAQGFQREVFSRMQEARVRAFSSGGRHRMVMNLGTGTAVLQFRGATSWNDINLPLVVAPTGSHIASVVSDNGTAVTTVTTGTYALVFNPSGEVYGQSTVTNDTSISPIDNAIILLSGSAPRDDASITVFGWTGKARLN
jgi:prepilin-type N-terminal cleavage/methylation domain-containing protein